MDNLALFFLFFGLSGKSPVADSLMIFGARFVIYLTFLLIFALAIKGGVKEKKALILAIMTIPIIILLIKCIHIFYYETRPFVDNDILPLISYNTDASFPSRHTSIMSAITFSYLYFRSKWAFVFGFLMLWVGMARIFVGVHFPIDIIGGIIVGLISQISGVQIIKLIKVRFLA